MIKFQWPWAVEKRESAYTDSLIASILQRAGGGTGAAASATGALESASGIVARCFASAAVSGPSHAIEALGPDTLAQIGRSLIRTGETLYHLDVIEGRLLLLPAQSWDVFGNARPDSWHYRLTLAGPDSMMTINPVQGSGVLHFRYMTDPASPWRGVGPIQSAALAGRLSAETLRALGDEMSGPTGSLLPVGADGDDPSIVGLKADIKSLGGHVALVEKLSDWATGGASSGGSSEWQPRRIGANPPDSIVTLAETASVEVWTACGIPPSLFYKQADGTGQREAFRRLLHSTVAPLARIVERELSDKLGGSVKLGFDSLFAADLSGRARAFQSLVGGGMEVTKAAALAGLMEGE